MSVLSPRQPPGGARERTQRRRVIGIIGVILFLGLFVVLVLNTLGIFHDPWSKIVAAILGVLGLIFNSPLVQDILKSISSLAINTFSKPNDATVQTPSTAQQITPSPTVIKSCIKREPMPIDPRIIPRQTIVEAIFEQLMHEDINAIMLTGLDGIGKTTLATLIFQYAENQRRARKPPFTSEALWIEVNSCSATTIVDLAELIFEAVGKRMPDFSNLDSNAQAKALFEALATSKKKLLVVLDQFDTLLDWQTGSVLGGCPGIGEWLKEINRRKCNCKILITGCFMWSGVEGTFPNYVKQYNAEPLETEEGVQLLREQDDNKRYARESKKEMEAVVELFAGHPRALVLLESPPAKKNLNLPTFLNEPDYYQFWMKGIVSGLFHHAYNQRLSQNPELAKLLLGFAVFREPVQPGTAVFVVDSSVGVQDRPVRTALATLMRQGLLQTSDGSQYLLHPLVALYVRDYYAENDQQTLKNAHIKAAQHYMGQYRVSYSRGEKQQHIIVEAIWHRSQAQEYEEAYNLIRRERIFDELQLWKNPEALLELLLLLDKRYLEPEQSAYIYNHRGRICYVLGRREQAKAYYQDAFHLSRDAGDRALEGEVLNDLGALYFDQGCYDQALAFFLVAKELFEMMQSPRREIVQGHIRMLSEKVSEKHYPQLLKKVEQNKDRLIDEVLSGGM